MKLIKYSMLGLFIVSLVSVGDISSAAPFFGTFLVNQPVMLEGFRSAPFMGPGTPIRGYSTPSAIHWAVREAG